MATLPRKSRSVIVTGGASGLGKAMSAYFAALGDAVTILDIDEAGGAAVSAELGGGEEGGSNVGFRRCDISSWAEQAAAFKAVYEGAGRVDVVVANAGVSEGGRSWVVPPAPGRGALGDEPEEPRLRVLDVNLIGNVYCMRFVFAGSLLAPVCPSVAACWLLRLFLTFGCLLLFKKMPLSLFLPLSIPEPRNSTTGDLSTNKNTETPPRSRETRTALHAT